MNYQVPSRIDSETHSFQSSESYFGIALWG